MKINQEFLELLEREGLSKTPSMKARGLFFGFLISFKDEYPELKNYLLDDEEHRAIFPYEDFQVYQIKLCKTNADTLKLELKVPMFGNVQEGEFGLFLQTLLEHNVAGSGHVNFKREFSIFSDDKTDKDALETAKSKLGEKFDLQKVCYVISEYYATSQYATKLATYLSGNAFIQDYKSYT